MTTFANSGNVQPQQGGEVVCASITGGPYDVLSAYVSGGSVGTQLEFRIYATVGTQRNLVAQGGYNGPVSPPGGGAPVGTLIRWNANNDPSVFAGGTQYDLVVYGVNGGGAPIQATLAGATLASALVDSNQNAVVAFPAQFASTTVVTGTGYAQYADVGVNQSGIAACAVDLYASCGAGSVEAFLKSVPLGGNDGITTPILAYELPAATSIRVVIRNTGTVGSGNVGASLSLYTETAATANVLAQGAVIFRPGLPSSGQFVETWAEVQAFVAAKQGTCIVYVDDANAAAHVPASSGITDGFGRLQISPFQNNGGVLSTLIIDNGATIKNLASVIGPVVLSCDCRGATPSLDWDFSATVAPILFLKDDCFLQNETTATAPAINVPGGGVTLLLQLDRGGIFLQSATNAFLINVAATSILGVRAFSAGLISLGSTNGNLATGAGQAFLVYDSSTLNGQFGTVQASFGTLTPVSREQIDTQETVIEFLASANNVLATLQADTLINYSLIWMELEGFGGTGGGGGGQAGTAAGSQGIGGGGSGACLLSKSSFLFDLSHQLNINLGTAGAAGIAGVGSGTPGGNGGDGGPTFAVDATTGFTLASLAGSQGGAGGGVATFSGAGGQPIAGNTWLASRQGVAAAGGDGGAVNVAGNNGNVGPISLSAGAGLPASQRWAGGIGGPSAAGQGGGGGGGGAGPRGNGANGGSGAVPSAGAPSTANLGNGAGGGCGGATATPGQPGGPGAIGWCRLRFLAP